MASDLCSHCLKIPFALFLGISNVEYQHLQSLESLRGSAKKGCRLCKILNSHAWWPREHFRNIVPRPAITLFGQRIQDRRQITMCVGTEKEVIPYAVTSSASPRCPGNIQCIDRTANSELNVEFMRALIDDCIHSHAECAWHINDSVLPTRLLYVGSGKDDRIRVVAGSDSESFGRRYLAVSHCWGKISFDAPWRLTKSRLSKYREHIQFDELSQTFQDIVRLSWDLKEQYLWIDSLCIIQDSREDWLREAAMMAEIYSNSVCTISAASSNSHEPCFSPRTPETSNCCILQLPTDSFQGTTDITLFGGSRMRSRLGLIQDTPVAQRAWCLQERELSTRIIQFTRNQWIWSCRSKSTTEDLLHERFWNSPTMDRAYQTTSSSLLPLFGSRIFSSDAWNRLEEIQNLNFKDKKPYLDYWYKVVEAYSGCGITIPSDRLPAISGVAKRQNVFVQSNYLAGLWEDDIAHGLLWRPSRQLSQAQMRTMERLVPNIAPSWSWASLNNKIQFAKTTMDRVPYPTARDGLSSYAKALALLKPRAREFLKARDYLDVPKQKEMVVGFRSAVIDCAGGDEYGQIGLGRLSMKGRLRPAKCIRKSQATKGILKNTHLGFVATAMFSGSDDQSASVSFDVFSEGEHYDTIICLYVADDDTLPNSGLGLALVPTKSNPNDAFEFTRVGYVEGLKSDMFQLLKPLNFSLI
ncbi:heterokaryon incompatibility protein-domain-containing protein [Massariosphaeria phaeospora]|uniref:Heterokaryon incompatibility protein-domain-containing protein n=1 Tax=Massariosphaeria phaeospora TaxID=100035 RepID=A0A7C8M2C2_9PLEO|nr:heterokaryon incompatibility protein-domain-containing protein [Massariosphaeria phaeospora]